jgi:hypothetical protein
VGKPLPGGENRIDERAAQHVALRGDGVVAPPVCATGLSQIAIGGLLGATPRGHPWTSAVPLPPGRNGLGARRMAVLSTFRALSLGRHVHRELMRSVWLDLTPIIAATACHQRNYVERYSRSKLMGSCSCQAETIPQRLNCCYRGIKKASKTLSQRLAHLKYVG